MRLSSIKLAGFKSFVDPTHFQLPGQLVGVVGPNGCGKSNIIDAVRWVLGESRASELRGDSMQDVIFNGSVQRSPAGRASVELVFDNSAGRVTGAWSAYAEIAVKRVLTRDGTSSYYINNQAVRRRDIQDIFLGTGLGPRAYAIIGQGMIARIIESRPEELRIFLEEAAGISKYKERRRETENRLADTRDNLTRVEDILRELNANLHKLESQAAVATQYKTLQAESTEKTNLLYLLRKKDAQAEQARHHAAFHQASNELEEQLAKLRHLEAELETLRTQHYAATDTVSAAQGALYEANAVVSRFEAENKFIHESRQRIQNQLATMQVQREQWLAQAQKAREDFDGAQLEQEGTVEKIAMTADAVAQHQESLPEVEARWRDAQALLVSNRAEIAEVEQQLKLEAAQQRHADQLLQQLQTRHARLQAESQGLDQPDELRLQSMRATLAEQQAQLQEQQQTVQSAQAALPDLEAARLQAQQQVQAEAATVARLEERLQLLQALQARLQAEEKVTPWLAEHGLDNLPSVWKQIQVTAGWENAFEAILRERLFALEVNDLKRTTAFINTPPPAKFTFYSVGRHSVEVLSSEETQADTEGEAGSKNKEGVSRSASSSRVKTAVSSVAAKLRPLLSLVKTGETYIQSILQDWLTGVYVADDFATAMSLRDELSVGETIVVAEGHMVGQHTVYFYAQDSERDGMLAREQEIDNITKNLRAQQLLQEEARIAVQQAEQAYQQGHADVRAANTRVDELRHQLHALQLETLALENSLEQFLQRSNQIGDELGELTMQIEEQRAVRLQAEENFQTHDERLAELQAHYQDNQIVFEEVDSELSRTREVLRESERAAQEAEFAQRNLQQRIAELERTQARAEEQAQQVAASLETANIDLQQLDEQASQAGLQDALVIKVDREAELSTARTAMDELGHHLRQQEESKTTLERSLQPMRDKLTDLQLKEQAGRIAQEQFDEYLQTAQVDEAELMQKIVPGLKPSSLQNELNRLQASITALGPVNMAALEELETATERKTFLDAQMADLTNASQTLEDAIRKIDSETRSLLQTTFDQINLHFGELFPMLFGGGQARLMMTGEEILDAGVQVLAQPPGKKNASIQLLSGGEKALTAIALVFAMFSLNPAPFCLLDEVDAPLDDSNTERYAQMVKRMSDKTQFMFISHNKIAMEIAEQLIGVTMQEQGVSRIVAVDITNALSLAEVA